MIKDDCIRIWQSSDITHVFLRVVCLILYFKECALFKLLFINKNIASLFLFHLFLLVRDISGHSWKVGIACYEVWIWYLYVYVSLCFTCQLIIIGKQIKFDEIPWNAICVLFMVVNKFDKIEVTAILHKSIRKDEVKVLVLDIIQKLLVHHLRAIFIFIISQPKDQNHRPTLSIFINSWCFKKCFLALKRSYDHYFLNLLSFFIFVVLHVSL